MDRDRHSRGEPCPYGHTIRYKATRGCVECANLASRRADRKSRSTPHGRATGMLKAAEQRAAAKGLPFTISHQWLTAKLATGVCEISGLPLDLRTGLGWKNPHAPSLDRRDSRDGYTPENARVILWALNLAFCNWGETAFAEIAEVWMIRRHAQLSRYQTVIYKYVEKSA